MRTAATPSVVLELLDDYGSRVREALHHYLPTHLPEHLDTLVAEYPSRGGKLLRPTLLLATARAFGGSLDRALGSAVALEMLHNALLIHDDIEDGSEERRGSPALQVEHGTPLALGAGDVLALHSLRPLLDSQAQLGPRLTHRLLIEIDRMARESARGQALELGWRRDNRLDLDESDYLQMVLQKTCWLTSIFPCRAGALIADSRRAPVDSLLRFGFFVGAAFQIQDDVLNLVGDHGQYGKEIGGDLAEGKRTLMLIRLFRQGTARERRRVREILEQPRDRRLASDIRWIHQRMDAYGCIDYARQIAWGLGGAALYEYSCWSADLPASRAKHFLHDLVTWVVRRSQ